MTEVRSIHQVVPNNNILNQLSITASGGSDVSQTETKAIPTGHSTPYGPEYKLDGFNSAIDSNVSVALARTGDPSQGSRSLSLFLIPLRLLLLPSPSHQHQHQARVMVSKFTGSRTNRHPHRPTAELELNGTMAYLVGH